MMTRKSILLRTLHGPRAPCQRDTTTNFGIFLALLPGETALAFCVCLLSLHRQKLTTSHTPPQLIGTHRHVVVTTQLHMRPSHLTTNFNLANELSCPEAANMMTVAWEGIKLPQLESPTRRLLYIALPQCCHGSRFKCSHPSNQCQIRHTTGLVFKTIFTVDLILSVLAIHVVVVAIARLDRFVVDFMAAFCFPLHLTPVLQPPREHKCI
ncbi:hypothetical protein Ae201684_014334 [Aphanomyces euteiches]|uniref:Uncharacterized protein n=1 Tax=Aphanomyces euteiches TaxID=100861 RepID=A0A6G0WKB9_9STRA|nr:hypothetical protein Ae201684_014334 [Aphanomyces euteiches]